LVCASFFIDVGEGLETLPYTDFGHSDHSEESPIGGSNITQSKLPLAVHFWRAYVPINWPWPNTCPSMAASSSFLLIPAACSSTVSSAYNVK